VHLAVTEISLAQALYILETVNHGLLGVCGKQIFYILSNGPMALVFAVFLLIKMKLICSQICIPSFFLGSENPTLDT
jgi:hypothetical protein